MFTYTALHSIIIRDFCNFFIRFNLLKVTSKCPFSTKTFTAYISQNLNDLITIDSVASSIIIHCHTRLLWIKLRFIYSNDINTRFEEERKQYLNHLLKINNLRIWLVPHWFQRHWKALCIVTCMNIISKAGKWKLIRMFWLKYICENRWNGNTRYLHLICIK